MPLKSNRKPQPKGHQWQLKAKTRNMCCWLSTLQRNHTEEIHSKKKKGQYAKGEENRPEGTNQSDGLGFKSVGRWPHGTKFVPSPFGLESCDSSKSPHAQLPRRIGTHPSLATQSLSKAGKPPNQRTDRQTVTKEQSPSGTLPQKNMNKKTLEKQTESTSSHTLDFLILQVRRALGPPWSSCMSILKQCRAYQDLSQNPLASRLSRAVLRRVASSALQNKKKPQAAGKVVRLAPFLSDKSQVRIEVSRQRNLTVTNEQQYSERRNGKLPVHTFGAVMRTPDVTRPRK